MTDASSAPRRARRFPAMRSLALAAAVALAAAAPYVIAGPSRSFVDFDDQEYVYENPRVLAGLSVEGARWALTTFHAANWHPLTWLSHMADVTLFGTDARGHHATSILLHAISAGLLFLALSRLTGAVWPSAFAAAAFGVHPLNVESVAWVAERKDVLSGACFALVLLLYERYARRGGALRYLAVALALALGLAAKPMLVSVPFVLLLLDLWPLGRAGASGGPGPWRRVLAEKVPLLGLSAVSAVLTVLAQRAGEALVATETIAPADRVANAAVSYAAYLAKALWPARLGIYYPHPYAAWSAWRAVAAAAALAAVTAAVLRGRRRRPFLAVGWFWFLGMLVPVIGLVQVGEQARADRYTYLPLIGLFVALAWGAPRLLRFAGRGGVALAAAAAAAAIALAGGGAVAQARHWRDGVTLFRHTLEVTEGNWQILNALGATLIAANRADEALGNLQQAIRYRPDYAPARYNLGVALMRLGRRAEAIEQYRQAVRLRPGYARARFNLGSALAAQGQVAEAAVHLRQALAAGGGRAGAGPELTAGDRLGELDAGIARFTLGNALAALGRLDEAVAEYRAVLAARPGWPQAHDNLGKALVAAGRLEEGLAEFGQALRLQPGFAEAHYDRGNALLRAGRAAEAEGSYREALRLRPGLPEIENNLANALAALGRSAEAAAHFREALRLRPDFPEARNNLAKILAAGAPQAPGP